MDSAMRCAAKNVAKQLSAANHLDRNDWTTDAVLWHAKADQLMHAIVKLEAEIIGIRELEKTVK